DAVQAIETGGELQDARFDVVPSSSPGLGEREEHAAEGGPTEALVGREVGPAEEGLAARREEDGERPAAVLGEELHRVLVDLIDVGALLAIDLDADEVLVHERG